MTASELDVDEKLSKALREVAEQRGLTYVAVARMTDKDHNTVRRWLTGERACPLPWVIDFCDKTETPFEYVLRKADLLPKVDVSAVIDADPEIDLLYKDLIKASIDAARKSSFERRAAPELTRRIR